MTIDEIRGLLAPVLAGAEVRSIARVDGGLVNTIYRVEAADAQPPLAVRVYSAGVDSFDRERRILERVSPLLPVPKPLLAVADDGEFPHPYVVYRWMDGITLNECRRQMPPSALLGLAEPLGRLAACVAAFSFDEELPASATATTSVARAAHQLRDGMAHDRLGGALADALRARLEAAARRLEEADRTRGLVHGDFSGRNIIVSPSARGRWRVAGLLDWENAFTGNALWDIGSLFRYAHRYSSAFRDRFALGYRGAGGALPPDWYPAARLLDATRLVGILSEDRELPVVFDECRGLVEALVAEDSP